MTDQTIQQIQYDPDTVQELRAMHQEVVSNHDPRSHFAQEQLGSLALLANEVGIPFNVIAMPEDKPDEPAPAGYTSREILLDYRTSIDRSQFDGIIHSLQPGSEALQTEVTELKTDTGKTIRLCDLRPFMTGSTKSSGPKAKADVEALDNAVLRDLKLAADIGHPKNSVVGAAKVGYTKLGKTKVRAYWMPVNDTNSPEGVKTYARLCDTDNSVAAEQSIYRNVFDKTLKK